MSAQESSAFGLDKGPPVARGDVWIWIFIWDVYMLRADSFDLERLKSARHLAHSFSLEAKLNQLNPHTHSREREHLREEEETCIAYVYFVLFK